MTSAAEMRAHFGNIFSLAPHTYLVNIGAVFAYRDAYSCALDVDCVIDKAFGIVLFGSCCVKIFFGYVNKTKSAVVIMSDSPENPAKKPCTFETARSVQFVVQVSYIYALLRKRRRNLKNFGSGVAVRKISRIGVNPIYSSRADSASISVPDNFNSL